MQRKGRLGRGKRPGLLSSEANQSISRSTRESESKEIKFVDNVTFAVYSYNAHVAAS